MTRSTAVRIRSPSDPNDRIVETYRREDGKVVRVSTGLGDTDYAYDSAGRLETTTLPDDTEITQDYTLNGHVETRQTEYDDGTLQTVVYNRNAAGQVLDMFVSGDPDDANEPNEVTSFTYTDMGQVETRTDPAGMVTEYHYDAQGHVTWMFEDTNDLDRATQYQYDPNNGNLSKFIGYNTGDVPQETSYTYDKRGNVTQITYPNGDQISMTYDALGRLATRTIGGTTINYAYDSRGRLASRSTETVDDIYTYDALGRMLTAKRDTESGYYESEVIFTYDALGRMTSESLFSREVSYTYDHADRRESMTLPGGEVVHYSYEPNSTRVDLIYPEDANDFLTVDYDYRGPAVIQRSVTLATDPNVSVDWIIERDGLLRMTESMNWRTDTGDANYTCLLAGFEYGRGDMGIPTSETFRRADFPNNPLTREFDYDTLHRLTDVDYPNEPNEEFYYDLAGNLTKYYGRDGSDPNFFANTANQYTRVEGIGDEPNGFAYDAAGNLTGDSRGYSFTYDHDNHLTQVTKGGSGQRSFYYDALGRRVGMMDYTEMPWPAELYIYSGQNVVEVRDASLDRQRYFIHGPTYIDERVQMVDDAIDLPFVYLMKDLYSIAGMTNWWGGLVETYDYDAYGRPIMTRNAQLPWACDLNNDGDIDQDDQDIFDTHYAGDGNEPNGLAGWRSDFDSDGDVGTADGIILAFLMN